MKNIQFIAGALPPSLIVELINSAAVDTSNGAYTIFCGQVRADTLEQGIVIGIEYSSYQSMASKILEDKLHELKNQYLIHEIVVIHSIGFVPVGSISVILFISSKHRNQALEAQQALLPIIKFEVPIWKKEIFENNQSRWT